MAAVLAMFGLPFAACNLFGYRFAGGADDPPVAIPAATPAAMDAGYRTRRIGIRVMKEWLYTSPRKDSGFVFSPLSLAQVLEMLHSGAIGDSRDAMQDAIWVPGKPQSEWDDGSRDLLASLRPRKDVDLTLANAVWVDHRWPLSGDYAARITASHGPAIFRSAMDTPAIHGEISDWVSKHTNGRFGNQITVPLTQHDLIHANALRFKGEWQSKFKRGDTDDMPFRLMNGSTVNVPMMNGKARCRAVGDEQFFAVEIPFRQWGFSLIAVAATDSSHFGAIQERLSEAEWTKLEADLSKAPPTTYDLRMPKFRMEQAHDAGEWIAALGMGSLMKSGTTGLMGMAEPGSAALPLYLAHCRQSVFMEVNEEGAEVVVVTQSASIGCSAAIRPGLLALDRPFVFAIRDNRSGALVAMGQVVDPR